MLIRNKSGDTIHLLVSDYFAGEVRLLKRGWRKIYVEIVDVSMIYPNAFQLPAGKRLWIHSNELYRDTVKRRRMFWKVESLIRRIFRSH